MQTRQRSQTYNQMKRSYPFSHVSKEQQIGRILNKHYIRIIFKPPKKIGQILRNPKDQRLSLSSRSIQNILFLQISIHWRNRENSQLTDKSIKEN